MTTVALILLVEAQLHRGGNGAAEKITESNQHHGEREKGLHPEVVIAEDQ
jgi:hypothetical protein